MSDRLTSPPVGPFTWPPDARPSFPHAVLRGLARVAASHPGVLDALDIHPGELPVNWPDGQRPAEDPCYGQYVGAPLLAMLGRIGHATPGHAHTEVALSAAALLLLEWADPGARARDRIDDALNKGCLSVRRWWEPKDTQDQVPRLLALSLPTQGLERGHLVPLARSLAGLVDGTPRFDNFERLVAYLQPSPERGPRLRPATLDATDGHAKEEPNAPPAVPEAPPTTRLTDPDPSPDMVADAAASPASQIATEEGPKRPSLPPARRFAYGLPDQRAREADAIHILRGRPGAGARRARTALDHVLPHARPADLHAVDWAYLKTWAGKATHHELAIVLALIYSGQPAAALPDWRICGDIAGCGADPGRCWLVLSPFGLAVPNQVNPHLPKGSAAPAAQVFLPFPQPKAGQPAHRLERLRRVALDRRDGVLFEVGELEDFARRFDEAARVADSAIRIQRLARALDRALFNQSGSALVWQHIRNAPPDTPYVPALHYARFGLDEIAEAYDHARMRIDAFLGADPSTAPSTARPLQGFVGSVFCPTDEQLRTVLVQPTSALKPLRGAPTRAKLTAFHNAMTRHTLGLLMVATAMRPTRSGFDSLQPLDVSSSPVQQLWKINDKPQLGTGGRVVPLPPMAQAQLRAYDRHRSWITSHRLFAPAVAAWSSTGEPLPRWFLFTKEAQIKSFTPRCWADSITPLKDNTTRHWMLNALRRTGWREDRIAVFAGHVGRVHSPTGAWSTLPPWTLQEQADVERILGLLGLQVREGMGNG